MKVGIAGGGIIGLSVGWQLLRHGAEVTLFDANEAGRGASGVAAGMLAPYAEAGFEELELMRLGEESLRLYPRFLQELADDVPDVPAFDQCGTLIVGVDRDDTEHLKRLYNFRQRLRLTVTMMTGSEAREKEPLLSPRVASALWLPDDAQIDNHALLKSLRAAFESRGGTLCEKQSVTGIECANDRLRALITGTGRREFDAVVMAMGCWTSDISGIPDNIVMSIRPIKGQILTLAQAGECELDTMIRSPRMYLVPKANGTIRLGATSEEKGFDTAVTAGGQKDLLQDAFDVVPAIYDLPVVKAEAGLRPASRDHAPIVGQTDIEGLYYATAHYRHGILMAPVTAEHLAADIVSGSPSRILEPFSPQRFRKQRVVS